MESKDSFMTDKCNVLTEVEVEERKHELWYFGHPYTCYEKIPTKYLIQQARFDLCVQRTAKLIEDGWKVFSPITHSHPIQVASIDLLLESSSDDTKLHRRMMDIDISILSRCKFTGLILAPDWESSRGCKEEYTFFKERMKTILMYEEIISNG